ncbi:GFA family protein [Roseibium salinum]|uniref:GFA family protein n=1 Tax=Roseibium salinum TaxID=1604349 RepID=A0ABT3R224_9HYPH|nr:GFA family protein [Roseibium sp. DSM 29163]MCX2723212.1 GFA family protein [Roseibium sp. DSM 29163]
MSEVKPLTGGCQCGAVRYRVRGEVGYPHLCHCRMCQKASGNFFLPLIGAAKKDFEWTRGEPSWFHSSRPVRRGFCQACGTPLAFDTIGGDHIAFTHGSLDDVAAVVPIEQSGVEGRVPFYAALFSLRESQSNRDDLPGGIDDVASSNCQHPDHDTQTWPRRNS